ncbi:MAG: 4-(cytidine 5'-diphospho)-2-C-methyl-D-erythritol kinase [Actinobacteria bacterium]|nr:4-(cytidine 5'-diphospho)-2-C-methyl-D-erythritol kinase [Actinomycetota bacterium]
MIVCEVAPAKINLTLEILNKRNDGYHEIKSLMQTIDLCDVLTFWNQEWLQVLTDYCNLPSEDTLSKHDNSNYLNNNLVYKAALTLKEETNYNGGAAIQLKKNIPSAAGLGGGSSDAAATLKGLNKLWCLGLTNEELAKIGSKIGSDIPFFIHGGTCLSAGRGEVIKKVKSIQKKWLAVILLPIKILSKTRELYSHVTQLNYSDGHFTASLLEYIYNNGNGNHNGIEIHKTENFIFNVFELIYDKIYEEYGFWTEKLKDIIKKPFHLTGSGPAIFYISDTEQEIVEIFNKIEELNLIKYIAQTVP